MSSITDLPENLKTKEDCEYAVNTVATSVGKFIGGVSGRSQCTYRT